MALHGAKMRLYQRWVDHYDAVKRREHKLKTKQERTGYLNKMWGLNNWERWATREKMNRLQMALLKNGGGAKKGSDLHEMVEHSSRVVIGVLERTVVELGDAIKKRDEEIDHQAALLKEQGREVTKMRSMRAENKRLETALSKHGEILAENTALRRELDRQRLAVEQGQAILLVLTLIPLNPPH